LGVGVVGDMDLCSICLELEGEKEVVETECKHFFHKECFMNLKNRACPICRSDVESLLQDLGVADENFVEEDGDDGDDVSEDGVEDSELYIKLDRVLNEFAVACYLEKINFQRDYSCCNTCGNAEICSENEKAAGDKKFYGYIFYHSQENDQLLEDVKGGLDPISIHLSWGIFNEVSDELHTEFAKKLQGLAKGVEDNDMKLEMEYDEEEGVKRKLVLHCSLIGE